ncbi:hypothetical protein DXV75_12280 [Alteromonas aestuariivivens]|uniref:Uncharacterized protein n=2 Tax=Alteromonas aestuariivivens TaxID=1938339 RepID=A0A3D8M5U7_9ALTE|nr:hypothetical protein DXV75_12280 [Alteromonas aestuariivivens]
MAGLSGLVLLSERHAVANGLALVVLLGGFAIAMTGYAGIFVQRFSGLRQLRDKSVNFDD